VRRSLLLLLVGALLALAAGTAGASAARSKGTSIPLATHHDGQVRDFRLYVAPGVPNLRAIPLLVVLHPLGYDNRWAEASMGLRAVADTEGVAVVYPNGMDKSWNAGTCCGTATTAKVDDVGLLVRIVERVASVRPIDRRRVFLVGYSNGGMMALRALCERPEVFAAAVSVAAATTTTCGSGKAVRALLIHGRADVTVPFQGTRYSPRLRTPLTPVPVAASALATRARCRAVTKQVEDGNELTSYRGCAAGGAVDLIVRDGLGHRWPTRSRDGLDAARLAWEFLEAS
jgi:polyhydroxybutyrate depolymerase